MTVEYSANVEEIIDVRGLVVALHEGVLATGVAPLTGLRTRAARRENYVVADGHEDNTFVAVTARFAPRPTQDRVAVLDAMVEVVESYVAGNAARMLISVEIQDIDPSSRVNRNNLRKVMGDAQ